MEYNNDHPSIKYATLVFFEKFNGVKDQGSGREDRVRGRNREAEMGRAA
jgi:hypothetical protein